MIARMIKENLVRGRDGVNQSVARPPYGARSYHVNVRSNAPKRGRLRKRTTKHGKQTGIALKL
jgi:hypothetical protein